jgi:serine/threonine protein kinase
LKLHKGLKLQSMQIHCTRPGCNRPHNNFSELSDAAKLKASAQRFCVTCGMPLLLQDRYVPQKLLGEGGFGAAYFAVDRYTPKQRPCVVKQFKPAFALNPKQLEMAQNLFFREAEVLETLGNEHPQIPDLFASFDLEVANRTTGGKDRFFYLVQEFIDGQTLEQELEAQGKFSEAAILEVLNALLPILEFIHGHQAIHRDIKPSNIMRNRQGLLYLLDFGAMRDITKGSQNTSTGIYSQGYAPPEQMAGQSISYSADLYGLAATCLVLMTGQDPVRLFDSAHNSWNWRHLVQISTQTADVLDRMLKAQPSSRYADTRAVMSALSNSRPVPGMGGVSAAGRGSVTMPPNVPSNVPPSGLGVSPGVSPGVSSPVPPPPVVSPPPPMPRAATPAPITPRTVPTPRFSLVQTIGNAAFAGFEGMVLAIGLNAFHVPGMPLTWLVLALAIVGLQFFRVIEGIDLVIFAGLTLGLAVFLFKGLLLSGLPLVGAAIGIAIFAALLFRLVYNGLSRLG